jgi:hypothetical protein
MSVRITVRPSAWNNSAPTGRIFMTFDIYGFFENLSRAFTFNYNRTRIKGTLHEDQYKFLSYITHFFLEWEMLQIKIVEKIKNHTLCSINRAVYEIMWKNIVERGMPQTVFGMRTACWIPNATNTFRLCKRHCFSTATMVARTRLNVTLYVHGLSCFVLELQHITNICNWSAHILSNATV